jgi:flagellar biosynthesis chaperone FliJ
VKRRSPFEVLAWLRSVDERRRRAELGVARTAYEDARARLEEMKARHLESLTAGEVLSAAELRSLQLRGLASAEILAVAAEERERTRHALEDRADGWRKAAADLDAAERLETQQKREAARRASVAAERSLNDLQVVLRRTEEEAQ